MGAYPNIGAIAGAVASGQQARQNEFEQPARMQALETATQGQNLQNQVMQQQLNDQKAMTAAMRDWDGTDYSQLPGLVIKHNGSANAVMGLRKSILDYQTTQATKTKTDLENENTVHDEVVGALSPGLDPKQVADADWPTWVRTVGKDLLTRKKVDPQHEQTVEALASLPPEQGRQQLDLIRKGYMGQTAINSDLAKQAEARMNNAKAALDAAQQEAANYKEDPNLGLVDLRTKQPISPAALAPLSSEEAAVLGKNAGDKVPLKLKNTASEILNRGIRITSANGRQLMVDAQGNTIKDLGTAPVVTSFNLQAAGVNSPPPPTADANGQPLSYEQQIKSMGAKGGTVKAIIEGRQDPPASFAQKSPYWQDVMQKVYAIDPGFNQQRAQLRKAYTVGPPSKEINAINTAMGHVGVLGDAIDALNNGDVKVLNSIANKLGVQVGKDNVTTFNTIVHRVGPELSKAYIGAGGSAGERGTDEKDFDPSLGPQQLKSNVAITAKLLRSKIGALENQWDQNKAPSMKSFGEQFITPEAKQQLDKWSPESSAGAGTRVVYARDKQGKLHQAPAGTPLPEGWKQENR
jgi:hypothetical protein